jgi:E3 ubiquitin-protein ligase HERC2
MNIIIPPHIVNIVQWNEVEDRCAGLKILDIEKLKSITQYRCCDENHKVCKWFWNVLERMSPEDQTAYLKFAWGRARMPSDCSNLQYKHRIAIIDYWDKDALPESHTCFFATDFANYESEEILEKKLLTSIRFCGEIDND